MKKLVFQRYTRIFEYFVKSISFSPLNKYSFKKSTRKLMSMLLRPRNLILFPALRLSMLHETEKRHLFVSKKPSLSIANLLKQADVFYIENQADALMVLLLKYQDSDEGEVLWRLARVLCEKAEETGIDRKRKSLIMKALQVSERAVEKNPLNYACHKWHAITLEQLGEFQGTKEKITTANDIKKHFTKAIELNDQDPIVFHLLGLWCFTYAEMSWYERQISSFFSIMPPKPTFQEALENFMKAEKIHPGLSNKNLLMIAKTHLRLKRNLKAKKYLLKTMNSLVKNSEDKLAYNEAVELMKTNKLDEL